MTEFNKKEYDSQQKQLETELRKQLDNVTFDYAMKGLEGNKICSILHDLSEDYNDRYYQLHNLQIRVK